MPRRVSMPAADDLFRPTVVPDPADTAPDAVSDAGLEEGPDLAQPGEGTDEAAASVVSPGTNEVEPAGSEPFPSREETAKQPSGRVRHDEKVTVYLTSAELVDLEQARLTLRAHHGLAVDRGRLVREAVSLVLAELDEKAADSALVQRLRSDTTG